MGDVVEARDDEFVDARAGEGEHVGRDARLGGDVPDDGHLGVAGAKRADGLFGRDAVGVAGLDDDHGVGPRGEGIAQFGNARNRPQRGADRRADSLERSGPPGTQGLGQPCGRPPFADEGKDDRRFETAWEKSERRHR
ncbi:hypothetical protein tb265_14700 [Gemmatimonadetes bacterium T265]|nr:hypothetical protein tb265_14700 [Gemmatimonadetes bacterium T265]